MAINFPNSPSTGNTYSYAGVTYTYSSGGYWAITAPATFGVASTSEVNDGIQSVKYVSPFNLKQSNYLRSDIAETVTKNWTFSGEVSVGSTLNVGGVSNLENGVRIKNSQTYSMKNAAGEDSGEGSSRMFNNSLDGLVLGTFRDGNWQNDIVSQVGGTVDLRYRGDSTVGLTTSSTGGTLRGNWYGTGLLSVTGELKTTGGRLTAYNATLQYNGTPKFNTTSSGVNAYSNTNQISTFSSPLSSTIQISTTGISSQAQFRLQTEDGSRVNNILYGGGNLVWQVENSGSSGYIAMKIDRFNKRTELNGGDGGAVRVRTTATGGNLFGDWITEKLNVGGFLTASGGASFVGGSISTDSISVKDSKWLWFNGGNVNDDKGVRIGSDGSNLLLAQYLGGGWKNQILSYGASGIVGLAKGIRYH